MDEKQQRYKHERLSQHAFVHIERDKLMRVVGEPSHTTERSSLCGHVSPTHIEAHVALIYVVVYVNDLYRVAEPDDVAPDSFLGGPKTFHYFLYI